MVTDDSPEPPFVDFPGCTKLHRHEVGAVMVFGGDDPARMVREPFVEGDAPDLQTVLDALDDPDCRMIVSAMAEPMTADRISAASDVPLSTTYRKLDLLSEASLLEEGLEIREDGQHATRYDIAFEDVIIALSESREFEVEITRRPRAADERLAHLWTEVRKET